MKMKLLRSTWFQYLIFGLAPMILLEARAAANDSWQALQNRFREKGAVPTAKHSISGDDPWQRLRAVFLPFSEAEETAALTDPAAAKKVSGFMQRVLIPYAEDIRNAGRQFDVPREIIADDLDSIYLVKPIERLLEAQRRIVELGSRLSITVGIIGGGPSSVEIAGNVWRLAQRQRLRPVNIHILTSKTLMPHHPAGIRNRALASLKRRGIKIVEGCDIDKIQTGRVTDTSGKSHRFDVIFVAIGVRPNAVFSASGIPTGPDGGMLVNRYLQSPTYPNIYGGGDCIYFEDRPLDKVGVYAVRQNPVLFHNLMAALEGGAPQAFDPGGQYLLIFNLGDGTGIFYKWRLLFGGRLAFKTKDYIDRKFMREFQAIE